MVTSASFMPLPRTAALRRALRAVRDDASAMDLLFLESWELDPAPGTGPALRVGQIRRANPALAAEIRAELDRGRPLTEAERAALLGALAGRSAEAAAAQHYVLARQSLGALMADRAERQG